MDDLPARAKLVSYEPAVAAIGTVVPRAEFAETAARGEFPATLLLDLDRVETGAGDATAHARIAVDWDRDTLDRLLASTEDEEIALWFDERELAQAFDDVEAHGLRERAAMLAIAVTAAGASVTPALAGHVVPMGGERGGQLTQQISGGQSHGAQGAAVQSMGTQRGEQLNQQISGGQTQSPSTEAPGVKVTPAGDSGLSPGELAAIAGAGAILISAAGFGVARKTHPPVRPA
jgi:hypothetical protein